LVGCAEEAPWQVDYFEFEDLSMTSFILRLTSYVVLPVCAIWWLGQLFCHLRLIRRFDVVVIDPHAVNYGKVVVGIDVARHVFPDKRVAFFFNWEPRGTQNKYLGKIWPDIEVLRLRHPSFFFTLRGRNVRVPNVEIGDQALGKITSVFTALMGPGTRIVDHGVLYSAMPVPDDMRDVIPPDFMTYKKGIWAAIFNHGLWARLLGERKAARPALPESDRVTINAKLAKFRGGRHARLCMLYNRMDDKDKSGLRDSSPIEAYLPAIHFLVESGYQVLLAGDQSLDDSAFDAFAGMVVDARHLSVNKELFCLFTPMEADICIGDAGAGLILPRLAGVPVLAMNAYPVGLSVPGTWVYPKRVFDKAGNPLSYEYVFKELPYGWYDPTAKRGIAVIQSVNTEEEILEAVKSFLADVEHPSDEEPAPELVELLPRESMFRMSGARLSPAFVRRYQMEKAAVDARSAPKSTAVS
jgi:putative glycosyltransferase (TIGR04372 family)